MRKDKIPPNIMNDLAKEDRKTLSYISTALHDMRLDKDDKLMFIHILFESLDKDNDNYFTIKNSFKTTFSHQTIQRSFYINHISKLERMKYIEVSDNKLRLLI